MQDYRERAQGLIKEYRAQIDTLKKRYRNGDMTKEQFMERRKVYSERINGIQAVFK